MGKRAKTFLCLAGIFLGLFIVSDNGLKGTARHGLFNEVEAAEAQSAGFEWFPNRPGITRAQVALGRAATLRFEFSTRGLNVSRVKVGIPKKFADMGIIIDPKEVSVKGDKATSTAIFATPPGTPLGKFDLVIVAVDAKTGKEIGRGLIPFMLLPAGVGGC